MKLSVHYRFYFFSLTDTFYVAWNSCIGRNMELRRQMRTANRSHHP